MRWKSALSTEDFPRHDCYGRKSSLLGSMILIGTSADLAYAPPAGPCDVVDLPPNPTTDHAHRDGAKPG
jgi:hypothetical protein